MLFSVTCNREMEKVPCTFQAFVYHEIGNGSDCARCSQNLALSLQYVLTELFFLYRQHCALFTSLERCLNSWRCFCQPPKTCWMRRTMVIPETLFSSVTPFFNRMVHLLPFVWKELLRCTCMISFFPFLCSESKCRSEGGDVYGSASQQNFYMA